MRLDELMDVVSASTEVLAWSEKEDKFIGEFHYEMIHNNSLLKAAAHVYSVVWVKPVKDGVLDVVVRKEED